MNSTPQRPSAAGEHFANAERLLAALPLVKRRDERARHVQIALVHAVVSIAAGLPGELRSIVDPEDYERLPPRCSSNRR